MRRIILFICVSVWVAAWARQTLSKEHEGALPKVIAHRGYWQTDGSAQNSIRSLVKADSIGCYGSEFDVWLTADDETLRYSIDLGVDFITTDIPERALEVITTK